jgi:hypothetical protein
VSFFRMSAEEIERKRLGIPSWDVINVFLIVLQSFLTAESVVLILHGFCVCLHVISVFCGVHLLDLYFVCLSVW